MIDNQLQKLALRSNYLQKPIKLTTFDDRLGVIETGALLVGCQGVEGIED